MSNTALTSSGNPASQLAIPEFLPGPSPFTEQPAGRNARIMIVDDEPINVRAVKRHLEMGGYSRFDTTHDATTVPDRVTQQHPDVILLDLMMPGMTGLEILEWLRSETETARIPVIILTATEDLQMKTDALELGATDFLRKPVDPIDLLPRVRNTLAVKFYQDQLRQHAQQLEELVRQRTAELEASRLEVIYCLGRAAEYRDNQTGRHVVRVGRYTGVIARQMGLDEEQVLLLEHAAPLHDLGKIGMPDNVLLKPGRLDPDEFAVMKQHSVYGSNIVSTMDDDEWSTMASHTSLGAAFVQQTRSPILKLAASIAMTHHERWDGTGYPRRLKGEQIPLEGRITAVADVFDALGSPRVYKPALPLDQCFGTIAEGRGSHFDPAVVDAFLEAREEVTQIYQELADDA